MLGLTSKKKAPALETLETAEIRVGRLPKEPLAALQELAALMDLLFSGSRIAAGQAYPIADLLDRTGRPHFRKIAQEYVLGHKQLTRFQNDRTWNTVTIYLDAARQGLPLLPRAVRGGRPRRAQLRAHAAHDRGPHHARVRRAHEVVRPALRPDRARAVAGAGRGLSIGRKRRLRPRKPLVVPQGRAGLVRRAGVPARNHAGSRLAGVDAAGADRSRRAPGGALRPALPHRHPAHGVDALLHRHVLGRRPAPHAAVGPHPGHRARLRRRQRDRRAAPDHANASTPAG